ncbi:hypothetical protein KVF89_25255 [Nocardioides carbamazepini]|uniref:SAF domain-containing protein n=1 Tax=Nocardioides carbamazepini TaxID=2854259 RepID=UPI002149C2A9|nr:SAF domain-containing protein [Nocardioides carbamazepini]MCR1785868.1 hypothetical protein [Nocardioides carbamazepini]
MTTTSSRDDRTAAPPQSAAPSPMPPPRIRRRPSLVTAGIAAICLGALLAVSAWTSTTKTQEVLAARTTIHQGETIEADDLQRVRINGDPALDAVPASAYDTIVGRRAALDIAAGGLLTAASSTDAAVPPEGQSIVGISLAAGQVPSVPLRGGDRVRVILTPGQDGEPGAGPAEFTAATVVATRVDETTGNTVVDVQVPYTQAGALAERVATGRVAVVLDSSDSGEQ